MTRLWHLLIATPLISLIVATLLGTNWRVFVTASPSPRGTLSLPEEPIDLVGQLRGSVRDGTVAVIEFADFQCPFSRAFALEVQPDLFTDYVDTGKVVWSFRHFPLTTIHSQARPAADFSECAAPKAGFWPVHDVLFEGLQATPLRGVDLEEIPGLDGATVQSCLQHSDTSVDRDLRAAAALGVSVTPTFLIGSVHDGKVAVEEVIIGKASIERYRKAIDDSLARNGATASSPGSTLR